MTSFRSALLTAAAGAVLTLTSPASAAGIMLQTTTTVANLRTEADSYGFIGFTQPFAALHACGSGTWVWVDMKSAVGRPTYATAMMALGAQRTITVRAHEDSAKEFGECQLYDRVLH